MNNHLKFEFQFGDHPIICSILEKIITPLFLIYVFFKELWELEKANNKLIFAAIYGLLTNLMFILLIKVIQIMNALGCYY